MIYIEANSGAVKRVGRCDAYATEFDLEAEEYVPLPKVGVGGQVWANVGWGGGVRVGCEGVRVRCEGVRVRCGGSGVGVGGLGWV